MNATLRQMWVLGITLVLFAVIYVTHMTPNDLTPLGRWAGLTSALILWGAVVALLAA